jgi:hypothetical protein
MWILILEFLYEAELNFECTTVGGMEKGNLSISFVGREGYAPLEIDLVNMEYFRVQIILYGTSLNYVLYVLQQLSRIFQHI